MCDRKKIHNFILRFPVQLSQHKRDEINKESNWARRVGMSVNFLEMTDASACIFNKGEKMSESRDRNEKGMWKLKIC